jgi:hypothetical protein
MKYQAESLVNVIKFIFKFSTIFFLLIFLYCKTFIYSDQFFSVGERHSEIDTLTYNKLGYEIAALINSELDIHKYDELGNMIMFNCFKRPVLFDEK